MITLYALIDPRDGAIRYVGKTNALETRLRRHKMETGTTLRHRWLMELAAAQLTVESRVLEVVEAEQWGARERYWIARLRADGAPLTNATSGGQGQPGHSPSPEHRENLRQALLRRWKEHPRTITPEHAAALRRGKAAWRPTDESRIKRSESVSRAHADGKYGETWRKNQSKAKTGRPHGPLSVETRRKIAERLRGNTNGRRKVARGQLSLFD